MSIFKNTVHIITGLKNFIVKDPEIEKLVKMRSPICAACPHFKSVVGDKVFSCALCGCNMALKMRSPGSGCKIGKWATVTAQWLKEKSKKVLSQ